MRSLESPADADEMNRVYVRCAMVAAPVDKIWENHKNSEVVTYLVAVRDEDGTVVARSPASTTNCYSPTPRSARACGHWPSTGPPQSGLRAATGPPLCPGGLGLDMPAMLRSDQWLKQATPRINACSCEVDHNHTCSSHAIM